MTTFEYQAKNNRGKKIKGVIEADSIRQVRDKLSQQELIPIQINNVDDNNASVFQRWNNKLKTKTLVAITRQLSTLITAGVPLDEALSAVIEQQQTQNVRKIITGVRAKVMEGLSLSQAMSSYPNAFPIIYQTTIAAGEKSGRLDTVLKELSAYTQKQQRLQQQIQQALLYPLVMFIVSMSVVIYLLSSVVPKILQVIQDAHQSLPWQTQLLLSISHTISHNGIWILIGLIVFILLFRYYFKKRKFKSIVQKQLLRLPIINKLLVSLNIARFARTLSITTAAGVPILEALHHANQAISLLPIQERISKASNEVREGATIHHAFRRSQAFPATFIYLIASGENSGQLDLALTQAADDEQHQQKRI